MRTLSAIGCLNLVLVTILAKPDVSHLVSKLNQSNRVSIDHQGAVTDHLKYTNQRIRKREANPNYEGDLRNSIPGEPGVDYPILSVPPYTSFSCQDRSDGYYADVEAQCQVFRVCANTDLTGNGFAFLCPNGTLFSQQLFVCDWYTNVDCQSSPNYYSMNEKVVRKITSHEQMMAAVKNMIEYPFRSRPSAAPGRGANSVGSANFAPSGGVSNIPERTKVYISSLGELSSDFGVKFDPKKSKIIKDYPDDTQPTNIEDDVITYGYPPRRNSRTDQSSNPAAPAEIAEEKPKQIYTYPTLEDEDKPDQDTKESQVHETAHLLNNFFLYNEEPKDDSRVLQRILDLRKQRGQNLEQPIPDDVEEPNLSSILHSSPLEINAEFLSIRSPKMYQYEYEEETPVSALNEKITEPTPTTDPFVDGLQLSVVDNADANADPINLQQRHLKPTLVPNSLTFNNDLIKENSAFKYTTTQEPIKIDNQSEYYENDPDVENIASTVASPRSLPSTEYVKKQQIIAMARAASKEKAKGLINEQDHTNVANILRAHSAVQQLQSDEHDQEVSTVTVFNAGEQSIENVTPNYYEQNDQTEHYEIETEPTLDYTYEIESSTYSAEHYNNDDVEVNTEVEPTNETDYSKISINHNAESETEQGDVAAEFDEKTVVNLDEIDPETTTTFADFYVTEENDYANTESSVLIHKELVVSNGNVSDELDPTDQGLKETRITTLRKVIVDSITKEYENEKRDISASIGDVNGVRNVHSEKQNTATIGTENPTLDEQELRHKKAKYLNINLDETNSYSFGGGKVETFKEPADDRGTIKFTDEKFKYLTSIVLKPGALKTIITLEHPLSLAPIVVPDEEDEEEQHRIETRQEIDTQTILNSVKTPEDSQTEVTENVEPIVDAPESIKYSSVIAATITDDITQQDDEALKNIPTDNLPSSNSSQILEDRIANEAREMGEIHPDDVIVTSNDTLPPEESVTLYSEPVEEQEDITEVAVVQEEIVSEITTKASVSSTNSDTDISPELYELLANAIKWEKQQARVARANNTQSSIEDSEQPFHYPQSLEFETTTKKAVRTTTTKKPQNTNRQSSEGGSGSYIGSLTSLLQGFFRNNFLTNNFQRLSGGGGNSIRRNSVELSADENLIENLSDEKIENFVKFLDQKGIAKNLSLLLDEYDDEQKSFDIEKMRVIPRPNSVNVKDDKTATEIGSLEKYRVTNSKITVNSVDGDKKVKDRQDDLKTGQISFNKGLSNNVPIAVKSSFDKYFQQQSTPSFQIIKSDDKTAQYFPGGNSHTAIDYTSAYYNRSPQPGGYLTNDATNHNNHKKPLDQDHSPNQRHESLTAYNSIALVKPYNQANLPLIQSITKSVEAAHFTTIDNVPNRPTHPSVAIGSVPPPVRENYPHAILNNHVTRYNPSDPIFNQNLQSAINAHNLRPVVLPSIAYSQELTPSSIAYSQVFTPSIPSLPTGAQPRRYDTSQESGSEKVVVQVVPARGFFLNDPLDRRSYYEAVSQGLLNENGFVYVNNVQTDNASPIQPKNQQLLQQHHQNQQQTTYPHAHLSHLLPSANPGQPSTVPFGINQLPNTQQRQEFRTQPQLRYQEEGATLAQQNNRRVSQEPSTPSQSSGYRYERPLTPFVY